MNVLLDTCALLALARGNLPQRAAKALRAAPEASVSVVSAWEIGINVAAGKIQLAVPPLQWFLGLSEHYALRERMLDAHSLRGGSIAAAPYGPVRPRDRGTRTDGHPCRADVGREYPPVSVNRDDLVSYRSSFRMTPVACASCTTTLKGAVSFTKNVSSLSSFRSPVTLMEIVLLVSPGLNVSTPILPV
jgi:uncharacterized protein with PIN domain